MTVAASTRVLEISGTRLVLDGCAFPFQGLSFFNAIFNPTFNHSREERLTWLRRFREAGVNALRVWCQWDFERPHADLDAGHSLFSSTGGIREHHWDTLVGIIGATRCTRDGPRGGALLPREAAQSRRPGARASNASCCRATASVSQPDSAGLERGLIRGNSALRDD